MDDRAASSGRMRSAASRQASARRIGRSAEARSQGIENIDLISVVILGMATILQTAGRLSLAIDKISTILPTGFVENERHREILTTREAFLNAGLGVGLSGALGAPANWADWQRLEWTADRSCS